jgi:lipoyl(octanoyl) transferase
MMSEQENGQTATKTDFSLQDWGVVDYALALQKQLDLVDLVHRELARDTIVCCSHPPVVTLGRGTLPGDVFGWQGSTIEVNRGGRATYHGPNQLVVYPILDLTQRGRDLHKYMRHLETAIVRTLAEFGVEASGKSLQPSVSADGASAEAVEATGVWIGPRKIASIGIGVRKWVSFHGLALNLDVDLGAFQGLKPCGFSTETMISLEEVLGKKVDRKKVQDILVHHLTQLL